MGLGSMHTKLAVVSDVNGEKRINCSSRNSPPLKALGVKKMERLYEIS